MLYLGKQRINKMVILRKKIIKIDFYLHTVDFTVSDNQYQLKYIDNNPTSEYTYLTGIAVNRDMVRVVVKTNETELVVSDGKTYPIESVQIKRSDVKIWQE